MSSNDRYSHDIFAGHQRNMRQVYPEVKIKTGDLLEDIATGWVGEITAWEKTPQGAFVRLEDRRGMTKLFRLTPGAFLYEGTRITVSRDFLPHELPQAQSTITNSGSQRINSAQAKIALPSRIWVEGVHDAAIVQKIWGEDLAFEGVAVEFIEGLDNLKEKLNQFQPAAEKRVGVLADHLLEGTKEDFLTRDLGPHVLVTGHPFIDIWEAVKPSSVGIPAWPKIPYGTDWKTGVAQELGWGTPQEAWKKVISSVHTYKDVDISLNRAVETLIDFVAPPPEEY